MLTPARTPSPDQERSLFDALFTSGLPLADLARSSNLTLLDLLELIASPRVQSRLVALEQAAAHAVRIAASAHLGRVLETLVSTIESHERDAQLLQGRADPEAVLSRRRDRADSRRAATALLRLARFSPLAHTASPFPGEGRRGGGEGYMFYGSSNAHGRTSPAESDAPRAAPTHALIAPPTEIHGECAELAPPSAVPPVAFLPASPTPPRAPRRPEAVTPINATSLRLTHRSTSFHSLPPRSTHARVAVLALRAGATPSAARGPAP